MRTGFEGDPEEVVGETVEVGGADEGEVDDGGGGRLEEQGEGKKN